MKDLLEAFSAPKIIEVAFYPFITLNKEIEHISLNRHRTRSILRIILFLLTSMMFMLLFQNNTAIYNFFINVTSAFNISSGNQSIYAFLLATISSLHIGNYISNTTVRSICCCLFGDPDFYLTKDRATMLEQQFRNQGNTHITKEHIYEVVDFCRKNLRKNSLYEDLGTKPEDWARTIESLLYDADLDHFLDQQKALKNKRLNLQKKIEAITVYKETFLAPASSSATASSKGLHFTSAAQNFSFPNRNSSFNYQNASFVNQSMSFCQSDYQISTPNPDPNYNLFKRETDLTECTPLLTSKNKQPYSIMNYNETTETIAIKELEKFKKKKENKKKTATFISEECLLHHCTTHLKSIEVKTEKAIYPETLLLQLCSAEKLSLNKTEPEACIQQNINEKKELQESLQLPTKTYGVNFN